MPLNQDDIITYKAIENSLDPTNGGLMSTNRSISGIRDNIFQDVSDTERLLGSTVWRKIFWKNKNSSNFALRNVKALMTLYTPGDDTVVFCSGTNTDTQNTIQSTTRFYGAAQLKINVSAGATSFIAIIENSDLNIFANADTIRISDTNNNEFFNNVSIIKNGTEIEITLNAGDYLINTYINSNTIISSVLPVSDLATSYENVTNNSTIGLFDTNESDIELFNLGTIYQNWVIKFYTTTQFTLQGDIIGYSGNGNINEDFIPLNTMMDSPYFQLNKEIWKNSWNVNDEIHFRTLPASIALWFKRTIPAGTSTMYNNFKHIIRGQATTQ
jgi:hypothetical protein